MRKFNKFLLAGILSISGLIIVSCGGGGSSASVQNPKYEGTYSGAATAGDMAKFIVSGTKLTYKIEGDVFGNKEGTLTLEPWGSSNGLFWKSTDGDVYLGIFNNIGVAYVKGLNATVVGLREVSSANDFDFAKTYNFVYVYKNIEGRWEVSGGQITFNNNTNQAMVNLIDGTTYVYNYEVNATLNSIDLKDPDTGDIEVHIVHKIGANNVEMFIADFTEGRGFAIGRESTPINLNERETYTVYYYGFATNTDDDWMGTATIYYNATIGKWIADWKDDSDRGKNVIYLNKYCYDDNNDGLIEDNEIISNNGTACAIALNDGSENRSSYENGIIDLNNQMFVTFGNDNGELFGEIGGW